jgi:hypothetical protein
MPKKTKKMKLNNIALLAAGAAAFFYIGYKKVTNAISNVQYNFSSIKIHWSKVSFTAVPVSVVYTFVNNNNFPVTIKWFQGKLFYGKDYYLSDIEIPYSNLKASTKTDVVVKYSIPPLLVAGELLDAIEKGRFIQSFLIRDATLILDINGQEISTKIDKQKIDLAEAF